MASKTIIIVTVLLNVLVKHALADWVELPSMPTPRSEMSAVYLNGKIYVPGGFGGLRQFEVFDIAKGLWSQYPQLPESRHHHMTAVHQGKIFVFGGGDREWRPTSTAFVYDPKGRRWNSLKPLPEPRYAGISVSLGKHIYIVGGDGPSGRLLRFEPETESWQVLAPTLFRREHLNAVAFEGSIVAIGGRFPGLGEMKSVEVYNIANNKWTAAPTLNVARAGHATTIHRKQIVVMGGEVIMHGRNTLKSVEVLENLDNQWKKTIDLPVALHGFSAVSNGSTLYVIGGSQRAGAILNRGQVFQIKQLIAPK